MFNCIRWPHFTIPLYDHVATNRFGNLVFAPLKLTSRAAWPPEGMHLVRSVIAYFDQPLHDLNNVQLAARDTFCSWRDRRWNTILRTHQDVIDGRDLLPAPEMLQIWHCINTIFFAGPIPRARFRWNPSLKPCTLGRATSTLFIPTILMNPHCTSRDFGDYVVLDFLSTLVHESIHVFLQCYPCWWCRSWDKDYTAGGHGRHFQTIAKKMEEVFPKLLGLPLKLGRFEAFIGDLEAQGRELRSVPSVHDIEAYAFTDVDRRVRNSDVRLLIERTYAERWVWTPPPRLR
ncbi:hypothetical protein N0V90_009382 [Kalmusia sp. IMI 367209]|nr:hypothetical protein N0V90_009382 [Kalmusia sp. IMI 367209]